MSRLEICVKPWNFAAVAGESYGSGNMTSLTDSSAQWGASLPRSAMASRFRPRTTKIDWARRQAERLEQMCARLKRPTQAIQSVGRALNLRCVKWGVGGVRAHLSCARAVPVRLWETDVQKPSTSAELVRQVVLHVGYRESIDGHSSNY